MCGCQGHEASTKIMFQKWWASIGKPQRYAYIYIFMYTYIYTRCIELAPMLYEDLHGSPMALKKLLEVPDVAEMKLLGCVSSFFLFGFGSSSQLWTSKMVILQHPFTFLWNHAMDFCTSKHWSNRWNTGKSPAVYGWDVGHKLPTETHGRPNGSGTWCH